MLDVGIEANEEEDEKEVGTVEMQEEKKEE